MKKAFITTILFLSSTTLLGACSPQADVADFSQTANNAETNAAKHTPDQNAMTDASNTSRQNISPSPPSPQRNATIDHVSPKSAQRTDPARVTSVRGIYITHDMLVGKQLQAKERFIQNTKLNAVVVDIKDDSGQIFTDARTKHRIQELKKRHIYTIARFVVFKDPIAAKHHPNWTIRSANGSIWRHQGVAWVDPTNPNVQSYNIQAAKRVAQLGVDEIQFDYVRFPDASLKNKRFYEKNFKRSSVIQTFISSATPILHQQNVRTSADVFGLVTSARDDMGIGQLWEKVSPHVDYISPMMYPSHYIYGRTGRKPVATKAYTIIQSGLKDAVRRNQALQKKGIKTAIIRPWLQDFDMSGQYNAKEVSAQIRAAGNLGVRQYLLWNQAGRYTSGTSF